MGGTMKGAHGHGHVHAAYSSSSSSSRRRWSSNVCAVMLIVCCVFGCGVLGLMGLHRLRERRSFSLLLKEKDDQIVSLHLLLQKEREHIAEVKKKTEEMIMEMMRLGSHKAELNSRISEMQQTISSLREEQKALESAFQEKQNEANSMREKYTHVDDQDPRVEALKLELRQREGEIKDLKHRLQQPHGAQVGSVSEEDLLPSNATAEANTIESEAKIDENEQDQRRKNTTTSSTEAIYTSSENGGTNAGDDEAEPKSMKEHENGKTPDFEQDMRVRENSHRFRGKHGYPRRAKGKRWRSIGKHIEGTRTSLSNAAASTMADQGMLNVRIDIEDNVQRQGTEELRRDALRNSSSESTHASAEELAKNTATKMDGVQHTEENEQSAEQISIAKPTEDKNEQQRTDLLGQKEVSGKNGEDQDAAQSRDSQESDDTEETEEAEF